MSLQTDNQIKESNDQTELEKLFDSSYWGIDEVFMKHYTDRNLDLFNVNHTEPVSHIYCWLNNLVIAKPIYEFLLLADCWCYLAKAVGTAEMINYYLHKPTDKVYLLYHSDYEDRCLAEPTSMSVQEAFKHVQDYHYHNVYKSEYRVYRIAMAIE